jgi:hypothetical protein
MSTARARRSHEKNDGELGRRGFATIASARIQGQPTVNLQAGFNIVTVTVVINQKTMMSLSGQVLDVANGNQLATITFPYPLTGLLLASGSTGIDNSVHRPPYVVTVTLYDSNNTAVASDTQEALPAS